MTDERPCISYFGILKGHRDWVTTLAVPANENSEVKLVSGSRDNTLVNWHVVDRTSVDSAYAKPHKRLEGHSGFVTDVALAMSGDYAISSSWDKSLRLWKVGDAETVHKFLGHTADVTGVAFSPDNRQIVSVSRDKTMRIWNVKGECISTISEADQHKDWISCVRYSPSENIIVTGSWDTTVKVWDANFKCINTLEGHTNAITSVAVSPDGSLCASASKDGKLLLWDLKKGECLCDMDAKEPVHQICFSPNRYWLVAATESGVKIFDLETKQQLVHLVPEQAGEGENKVKSRPQCLSVCWSCDGSLLYSGYTDGSIRLWKTAE